MVLAGLTRLGRTVLVDELAEEESELTLAASEENSYGIEDREKGYGDSDMVEVVW